MDQRSLLLSFWEKEASATRTVISRIPEGSTYRPDPKSRTASEIAWLIVREEAVLIEGLEKGRLAWEEVPLPATMKAVLDQYDALHANLSQRFQALDPAAWERPVPFMFGEHEIMRDTGYANAWGFLFDLVHHRGQLSTYLRAMGSTVPQIYGPSADEP